MIVTCVGDAATAHLTHICYAASQCWDIKMMRSLSAVFVFENPFSNSHIADSSTDLSGSLRDDDLIRELAHSKLSDAKITDSHLWSVVVSILSIKPSKFCFSHVVSWFRGLVGRPLCSSSIDIASTLRLSTTIANL